MNKLRKHIVLGLVILLVGVMSSTSSSVLARPEEPTYLQGVVKDDRTGQTLSGAYIELYGPAIYTVLTNQTGAFHIEVQPGLYDVFVTRQGYKPLDEEVTARYGLTTYVTWEMHRPPVVDLGWYLGTRDHDLASLPNDLVNTVVLYTDDYDCQSRFSDIRNALAAIPDGIDVWVSIPNGYAFEAYHDCRNPMIGNFGIIPDNLCGFAVNRQPVQHDETYCAANYLSPVRDSITQILSFPDAEKIRGWYLFDEPYYNYLSNRVQEFESVENIDEFMVGDWDGDGDDTVALRRGDCLTLEPGTASESEYCFSEGVTKDEHLVGDWNGDGVDRLGYRVANCVTKDWDGVTTQTQCYAGGNPVDEYLVGDWDGDGTDNLAVRIAHCVSMDTNLDGDFNDRTQCYGFGNDEDEYLVGNWNGDWIDYTDNLAVRRDHCVLMDYNFDGAHDREQCFGLGNDEDEYLVGDWAWHERDYLGVRHGGQIVMNLGGMRDGETRLKSGGKDGWSAQTLWEIRNYVRFVDPARPTLGVVDYNTISSPNVNGAVGDWQPVPDLFGIDLYPKFPSPGQELDDILADFQPISGPSWYPYWGWRRLPVALDRLAPVGSTAYYIAQAQGPTSGERLGYSPGAAPSLREVRYSAWTPLIRGVQGVLFWWWPFSDNDRASDGNLIRESVHEVFREIRDLEIASILFEGTPSSAIQVASASSPIDLALREYKGGWYLLISNNPETDQLVQFQISITPPDNACNGQVLEMIGGSTIPWERSGCTGPVSFWDSLSKGDVRAYRLFESAPIIASPSPTTTPTVSATITPSATPEPSPSPTTEITPVSESIFIDVPLDHWAAEYVKTLYNEGYSDGCYDDGEVRKFCGEDKMTRAEMSVFLARAINPGVTSFQPPEPTESEVPFLDPVYWGDLTPQNEDTSLSLVENWFNKWTVYTYEERYYRGCRMDEVFFCPLDGNTRAELTVLIERLLHGVDYVPERAAESLYGDVPLFDDTGERYWASDWVMAAHNDGLIQACGTDMERMLFFPEEIADRYTAACMFYYALLINGS